MKSRRILLLAFCGLACILSVPVDTYAVTLPCDQLDDYVWDEEGHCLNIRARAREAACAEASAAYRRLMHEYLPACVGSNSAHCQDLAARVERARDWEQRCFEQADINNDAYNQCMEWVNRMRNLLSQVC